MTGDGSKEHPFSVTSVGDEYNFVEFLPWYPQNQWTDDDREDRLSYLR